MYGNIVLSQIYTFDKRCCRTNRGVYYIFNEFKSSISEIASPDIYSSFGYISQYTVEKKEEISYSNVDVANVFDSSDHIKALRKFIYNLNG